MPHLFNLWRVDRSSKRRPNPSKIPTATPIDTAYHMAVLCAGIVIIQIVNNNKNQISLVEMTIAKIPIISKITIG